jgi:hypothetical protein
LLDYEGALTFTGIRYFARSKFKIQNSKMRTSLRQIVTASAILLISARAFAADAAPAPKSGWDRIVMVGASATAGFVETEPLGGPRTEQVRWNRYLDATVQAPHEPIQNFASALLFMNPEQASRDQLARALQTQPTVVVGIDFLFWFCYGRGSSDGERLQRFERGLKLLEDVQCPLIVGDIPDASAAVNRMLGPDEIPSEQVRSNANRRLKEWAAGRKQVVLFDLANIMSAAASNQVLSVHGLSLAAGKTRALLQNDMLHPSARGCAVLAVAVVDSLRSAQPTLFAGPLRTDPAEVFRIVNPPKPPAEPGVTTNAVAVPLK